MTTPTQSDAPEQALIDADRPVSTSDEAPVRAEREAEVETSAAAISATEVSTIVDEAARARPEARDDLDKEVIRPAAEVATGDSGEPVRSESTEACVKLSSFETIVAEMADYSKRCSANGAAFVAELLGAKSFSKAIQVQFRYAATSHADFVAHLAKVGQISADLARAALERRLHSA